MSKNIIWLTNKVSRVFVSGLLLLFACSMVKALNIVHPTLKSNNQAVKKKSFAPSAKFERVWVDYDIIESGKKGMLIHVQFSVMGMKGVDSYLALYFETLDGKRLKDKNGKFNSANGEVAVYREMKPGFDNTVYKDLSVFMPYEELDLNFGNWDLQIDVDLIYKSGGLIQHLTFKGFNYRYEDDANSKKSLVNAKLNRVWVDNNVTVAGLQGILIHVNFDVKGLKGKDAWLVARVQKKAEVFLQNGNEAYSNKTGELEVKFKLKPAFDNTVYNDAQIFLPYREIHLPKGFWDLKLDIDLIEGNGDLIQHLTFHNFGVTK